MASMMAISPAEAQVNDIEIAAGVGLMDRSTSGIGPEVGDGLGRETGLAVDLDVRVLLGKPGMYQCIHAGFGARGQHMAGEALGLADVGFRVTIADVGFRLRSGCLELGDWLLTGYGGASVAMASADEATIEVNHTAIGGHVGADLSLHAGSFFFGPFLDVRYMAAFGDGPAERVATATIGLRFGYDLELGRDDDDEDERYERDSMLGEE